MGVGGGNVEYEIEEFEQGPSGSSIREQKVSLDAP
jgi:hypothetical protein